MTTEFFLRKTLRLLISLVLFSLFLYCLLRFSAGDPALGLLRRQGITTTSQKVIDSARASLGLEGSFGQQYFGWLMKLVTGNLGNSFTSGPPVSDLIRGKIGVTCSLVGCSFLISTVFSLVVGSLLGNVHNTKFAQLLRFVFTVLLSFPVYWIAIILMFILGVTLSVLPFVGSGTPLHLVMPVLVICLSEGLYLTKMVSDLVVSVSSSRRQILAKFRGIRWYYRVYYQLKQLSVPLVTLYGTSLTHVFGISVMVEILFSISGMGKLLMDSILSRDYPVIQAITLIIACSTFVVNYIVDMLIAKWIPESPFPTESRSDEEIQYLVVARNGVCRHCFKAAGPLCHQYVE